MNENWRGYAENAYTDLTDTFRACEHSRDKTHYTQFKRLPLLSGHVSAFIRFVCYRRQMLCDSDALELLGVNVDSMRERGISVEAALANATCDRARNGESARARRALRVFLEKDPSVDWMEAAREQIASLVEPEGIVCHEECSYGMVPFVGGASKNSFHAFVSLPKNSEVPHSHICPLRDEKVIEAWERQRRDYKKRVERLYARNAEPTSAFWNHLKRRKRERPSPIFATRTALDVDSAQK